MILVLAALAAEDPVPVMTAEGRMAEYKRLETEILGLAQRGHWSAVDRLLEKLEDTGQPHTQEALVVYAQAASRRGDIFVAKQRLEQALSVRPDSDIDAWLQRIHDDYSPVLLAADLPANYRLTPERLPFLVEARSAVAFAQQAIIDESLFQGLLPRGNYTFHPYGQTEGNAVIPLEVRGGRRSIDLRTKDEPTAADRRKRARIDKKLSKHEAAAQP